MMLDSKPCIFMTSTGRTATQFLGHNLSRFVVDCTSLHEPDSLWLDRPQEWYKKMKEFGVLRMTVGKMLPRYSLRTLSVVRYRGQLPDEQIVEYLRQLRAPILRTAPSTIYGEANGAYCALVDLLPHAFPNARVVYIIRDPRAWVQSWMNMNIPFYSWRDVRAWLPYGRLQPGQLYHDPYAPVWRQMSQFEKLCWAWARENAYAVARASQTDAVRVFRFEDLFEAETRMETFRNLLEFVTCFPNGLRAQWVLPQELLSQRVHSTKEGKFPPWTGWSSAIVKQLDRYCRPVMERFHYGQEPEWQEKLARV